MNNNDRFRYQASIHTNLKLYPEGTRFVEYVLCGVIRQKWLDGTCEIERAGRWKEVDIEIERQREREGGRDVENFVCLPRIVFVLACIQCKSVGLKNS